MREFSALCRRRRKMEEGETYRAAFIVSSIYNVNRGKGVDPIRPEDFMSKKKPKQSAEDMLAAVKMLHAKVGGKSLEG